MMRLFLSLGCGLALLPAASSGLMAAGSDVVGARATVVVVAGAPGEAEFVPDFKQQVEAWAKVSAQAGAEHIAIGDVEAAALVETAAVEQILTIGPGKEGAPPATSGKVVVAPVSPEKPGETDRDRLKAALEAEPKDGNGELWIVLIGHGTFDGKDAKLNLRGPDVSATELSEWLKPFERPLAIIDTTSSSAPFLAKLAGPKRVVVSATRSGHEQNYARFGKFLAEALPDPKSDLDKDGQISLLEAFLSASHRTAEFYKTDGRLATEHALIDDNGDGLGTPADWYRGVIATKRAQNGALPDGPRAHQFHLVRSAAEQHLSPELRARRDKLELDVAALRERKAKMNEEKYYQELEKLLLQLAELYEGT